MKVVLADVANLENEQTAVDTINANAAVIETAFDNTVSRDGTSPNTMGADFDMNSHRILNLPAPTSDNEPLRKVDYAPGDSVTAAAASALAAAASASSVAGDAVQTAADRVACDGFAQSASDSAVLAASYTGAGAVQYDVAQSLNSTQQGQARDNIGLGTAAVLDTGTSAGDVVVLDGSAKLPAVDASNLTNLPASTVPSFETRALLAASNLSTITAVWVMRYSTACPFAPVLYTKLDTAPSIVEAWHVEDAGSNYWELTADRVTPDMFGAIGDNATDDRTPVQSCFDYNLYRPVEIFLNKWYYTSGGVGYGVSSGSTSGTIVRGVGPYRSGLSNASGAGLLFQSNTGASAQTHVGVFCSDFGIDNLNTGSYGVFGSNIVLGSFERMHISRFNNHGIYLTHNDPTSGALGALQVKIELCRLNPSTVNASVVGTTNCVNIEGGNYVWLNHNYFSGFIDSSHHLGILLNTSADSIVSRSNILESANFGINFAGGSSGSLMDHPVGSTITSRHFEVAGSNDTVIFHPRGTILTDVDYSSVTAGHLYVNIYLNQHGYYSGL